MSESLLKNYNWDIHWNGQYLGTVPDILRNKYVALLIDEGLISDPKITEPIEFRLNISK